MSNVNELVIRPPATPVLPTRVLLGRGAIAGVTPGAAGAAMALVVVDRALPRDGVVASALGALGSAGIPVHVEPIVAREQDKSLATCERLLEAWSEAGAGRDAVVVAIGGGLVSDVAGFSAACFMRGVRFLIVPTTTLSMADAALGGKTGVNTRAGKNLAGAVHHPAAVLADLDALAGLPREAFVAGFAEVVKAALVGDAELLADVEVAAAAVSRGDADAAGPLLFRALRVKARVVEADPLEQSRREILNFGHTVAHAIEHASAHAIGHGEAVATGVIAEGRLAERMGRLPAGTSRRVASLFDAIGLPWRCDGSLDADDIARAMRRDKKVRAGVVRVALPSGLGAHEASPSVAADPAELVALLSGGP